MRGNLALFVGAADRARLAAIVADRNSPQKHVWRAEVILLTAERLGTVGDVRADGLFSYVSCEARVPGDHPLRPIRAIVDHALDVLGIENLARPS